MPRLIMLSGPSAGGKSTAAREMLSKDGNMVRINRDDLRRMSLPKWTPRREEFIRDFEKSMVRSQAKHKTHIIVDDTNLTERDETSWKGIAKEIDYEFQKIVINPGLSECLHRDGNREPWLKIGRAAIERQFLKGKLVKWPEDKQVVIFDIDGTLADLTHRTGWIQLGGQCPNECEQGRFKHSCIDVVDGKSVYEYVNCSYCVNGILQKKQHDKFYSLVEDDAPIEIVVKWAQATSKDYMNIIVSGRSPEKSEEGTLRWLKTHGVPFEHIYMRRSGFHGPDVDEKQTILNMLLDSGLSREKIAFVVDDRPSVVEMWRRNGIKVFPVRGRDDDKFYELMDNLEKDHPVKL